MTEPSTTDPTHEGNGVLGEVTSVEQKLRDDIEWFTTEWKLGEGPLERGKWLSRLRRAQAELDELLKNK